MTELWKSSINALEIISEAMENFVRNLFEPVRDIIENSSATADLPPIIADFVEWFAQMFPENLTLIGLLLGTGVTIWVAYSIVKWALPIS